MKKENIADMERKNNMYSLIEMLRYMRPEGSTTQLDFCERFLQPMFGLPDRHGNYILTVLKPDNTQPNLCFTSHHDTVHSIEGMQKVVVKNNIVSLDQADSSCLGADCTTGVWIMLNMIESDIPGVYVIHAGEEVGCKGSSALVKDEPDWFKSTDAVISFDRREDNSIVTHQMGMRTASDEFAQSFSDALDLPQLLADSGGSYTDSNEYSGVVSECTNISVGYRGQHSQKETQDLDFLDVLMARLIAADWSKLVFKRDCTEVEYDRSWLDYGRGYHYGHTYDERSSTNPDNIKHLLEIIEDHPKELSELLNTYGFDAEEILGEIFEYEDEYCSYNESYGVDSNKVTKYIQRKGL